MGKIELYRRWRKNLWATASDFQTLNEVIKIPPHEPRSTEYNMHVSNMFDFKSPCEILG